MAPGERDVTGVHLPSRHRRWAAVVLVLGLALAGCSADGDDASPTAGTLDLAPATTATTTPDGQALSDLVVTDPPLPGFVLADDILGAGPLDLGAAAASEPEPTVERALLEETGFERGASRAWLSTEQDAAYVAIYGFATPEGAAAYADAASDRLVARGATPFDVPEVPGATGLTTVEEAEEGTFTTHAVSFVRDDRWVLVLVASPTSSRSPEDARALAAAQADRIP